MSVDSVQVEPTKPTYRGSKARLSSLDDMVRSTFSPAVPRDVTSLGQILSEDFHRG
jgi:hypothetical protein